MSTVAVSSTPWFSVIHLERRERAVPRRSMPAPSRLNIHVRTLDIRITSSLMNTSSSVDSALSTACSDSASTCRDTWRVRTSTMKGGEGEAEETKGWSYHGADTGAKGWQEIEPTLQTNRNALLFAG